MLNSPGFSVLGKINTRMSITERGRIQTPSLELTLESEKSFQKNNEAIL